MKLLSEGAVLSHADRRMDGRTDRETHSEANSRFSHFFAFVSNSFPWLWRIHAKTCSSYAI